MSILDTLITDRTQADVNRIKQIMAKGLPRMTAEEKLYFVKGQLEAMQDSTADTLVDSNGLTIGCRDGVLPKGSYNYTDLNRVMDAVDYLTGVIRSARYEIDDPVPIAKTHKKIIKNRTKWKIYNKVSNPTFNDGTNLDGWVQGNTSYVSATPQKTELEFVQIEVTTAVTSDVFFLRCPVFSGNKNGHTYYVGFQYLNSGSNSAEVYINRYTGSTASSLTANPEKFTNTRDEMSQYSGLFTADSTVEMNYLGFGIASGALVGDIYYIRRPFCYDITDLFGAGNEPTLEWCQKNIGYNAGMASGFVETETESTVTEYRYAVQDIPTPSEMEIYLSNIQRVISRLPLVNVRYDPIPTLPDDMDGLLPAEANNIEKLLPLIADTIERLLTERLAFYSGELFGGEV